MAAGRRRGRRVSRLARVSMVVVCAGCAAPGSPPRIDLVAAFRGAGTVAETGRLDLGTPEARRALGEGWSQDETSSDGTSFAWGLGAASWLEVRVLRPGPRALRFRCWAFAPAGTPAQSVRFRVGERDIARVEVSGAPSEYSVRLPADALPVGSQRVELVYDHATRPSHVVPGTLDGRALAVGWDWIEWTPEPAGPPRVDATELVLPAGAGARFAWRAVEGDRLGWAGLAAEGEGRAGVRLVVRSAEGRSVHEIQAPSGEAVLDPGAPAGDWVALDLLPVTGAGVTALRIERPVVLNPAATLRAGPAAARSAGPTAPTPGGKRPNLLLYVIDTLRADHLGCYGATRASTPGIDAFAAGATLFEHARAASSWTKTSMATILTGLPPRSHGAHRRTDALAPEIDTLAERLAAGGYATAAFVTNPNLAPSFGFDQGFETYAFLTEERIERGYVRSDALHRAALDWLERPRDRPFFLYLHSMDPHDPYVSGPDTGESVVGSMAFMRALEQGRIGFEPELRERLMAAYDREIAFNDRGFAGLVEALDERGLADDTLVVLVADHGEEFFDHGWWRHGKTLFEEQLQVPLVIRWPGRPRRAVRVSRPALQQDLAPTLLAAAGLAGDALPGRDLATALVAGGSVPPPEPEFALLDVDGRDVESLRLGPLKLIRYLSYDRPRPVRELYDLDLDPREALNAAPLRPALADRLEALLEVPAIVGRATATRSAVIDPELAERLRAVGYLH